MVQTIPELIASQACTDCINVNKHMQHNALKFIHKNVNNVYTMEGMNYVSLGRMCYHITSLFVFRF